MTPEELLKHVLQGFLVLVGDYRGWNTRCASNARKSIARTIADRLLIVISLMRFAFM